ncbi:MAG TPA: cell division protein FtsW [Rhodospirillaceae bacterium]|nr:cell division protein FtsW [Rhodospirillaceae bacterium]
MKLFSRTDQSFLGRWWWTVDRPMLAAAFVLVIFGVVLVTTASPPVAEHLKLEHYHFLKRHVVMLVPAVAMMLGISMLSPRSIWRMASILFAGCIVAMIIVLVTGMEIKGAQRWIHLFGFSLQPSEFIKPAFAVVAAWLMGMQKTKEKFPGNRITAGLYALVLTLLLMQPDLGMTVVVTSIWVSQIFLAGFPFRILIGLILAAAIGLVLAYFTFDHVHSRMDRFLDPASGDNYQVQRSLEAFENGGLFGTGPGQGTVKENLPDGHADFIFAVAGEELGMFFVLILMSVYAFILLRGYNRLMDSDSMFTVLAVGGLLTMFGLQAMIHMGSSVNLLPAKGMTLPFISYGGSSILSTGLSMGIILSLTRRQVRSGIARGGVAMRKSLHVSEPGKKAA